MAVSPKCKVCKEEINKNDESSFVKKSNGYYHTSCKNQKVETKKLKPCSYCKGEFESENDVVKRGSLVLHEKCLAEYQNSDGEVKLVVRLRTCPKCKEKVNPLDEGSIDTDSATYHKTCYEAIQRQKKNRDELLTYISLKYNVEFPTGYMLKQITDYHNKRGYSYKAMLATLKYMFEVEKVTTKEGVGIGLLPYYFEKAKSYYSKIMTAGKSADSVTINNTVVKVRAIEQTKRSKAGYIDLNSL